jgi:hypothetical protein
LIDGFLEAPMAMGLHFILKEKNIQVFDSAGIETSMSTDISKTALASDSA